MEKAFMILLVYDYIKNHYRLIAVDLSRQKELDADPKSIQQIELVGQLKNSDDAVVASESTFVLTILEKIKETRLQFSQGSVTILQIITNYQETRVKVTNALLNKLKSAARNKTGTIIRLKNCSC